MKDKSRKRRRAIRLMDKQNERMRWLYSIQQGQNRGEKRRMGEGCKEGIERGVRRGGWREGCKEGIEREIATMGE